MYKSHGSRQLCLIEQTIHTNNTNMIPNFILFQLHAHTTHHAHEGLMSSADGLLMSIAVALSEPGKSFEEVRIDDYIKAYLATSGPPLPVPQVPTDEFERTALNLPPLFKPLPVRPSSLAVALPLESSSLSVKPKITNAAQLPLGQEFRLLSTDGEKYHCITCMSEYANFSQEEMRYHAYLAGNIKPPLQVQMHPFVPFVKDVVAPVVPNSGEEQLLSISTQPQYEKHSHEELRVAFLLHGRELTSVELFQLQNPSATPALAPPTVIATPAPSIPPPIFASTTTSTAPPRFTFGLR
ncbi:hypothetical protein B0H34DRAFT_701782 [Crassisporium funariophilum]|nr:hypothetical protein B0H34DRAFT_701782 [Crassisporium funariophilum]